MRKRVRVTCFLLITIFISMFMRSEISATEITTKGDLNKSAIGDISKGASGWAVDAIGSTYSLGILTRDLTDNYQDMITRKEFAQLSVKLYEYLSGDFAPTNIDNLFADTNDEAVLEAYSLGIVKGKDKNLFQPEGLITRQELCVMLYRTIAASLSELDDTRSILTFEDNSEISDWALVATEYMSQYGIVKGVSMAKFMPTGNATREAAIVMIDRICDKQKDFMKVGFGEYDEILHGSQGYKLDEVKELLEGWYDVKNLKLPTGWAANDDFDDAMLTAVKLFQEKNYLCCTDSITYETWEILHDESTWELPNRAIQFNDVDLEAAIRKELKRTSGTILLSEVQNIKSLTLDDVATISDLEGIQYLKNLDSLDIYDQDINDYSLLSKFYKLESLTIENDNFQNLNFLNGLNKLTYLNLTNDEIESLDFLEGLDHIESLNLDGNNISDLYPLAQLEALSILNLSDNKITSLSAIRDLELTYLFLNKNEISDIEPLADMSSLRILDLDKNNITNIDDLSRLTKLFSISLNENQIASMDTLTGLNELAYIYISANQLTEIPKFDISSKLEYLDIGANQIKDLSPLKVLSKLECLFVEENPLNSLTGVEYLTYLSWLDICSTNITDITPLTELTNLEYFDISGYDICSFEKNKDTFNQIMNNNPDIEIYGYGNYDKEWYKAWYDDEEYFEGGPYFHNSDDFIGLPLDMEDFEDGSIFQKSKSINEILAGFNFTNLTDHEKITKIYEYITSNVKYDMQTYNAIVSENYENIIEDSVYYTGAMLDHSAICSGYSKTVMLLCQYAGLECHIVTGDVTFDGETSGHAWNVVKVNGQFYQLDSTWDSEATSANWEFFLISDALMKSRGYRTWDETLYPVCPSNFY